MTNTMWQLIICTQRPFFIAMAGIIVVCLTACAIPTPTPPNNLEVIDTLHLPAGKSIAEFNRDLVIASRQDGDNNIAEYRLKGQLYKMIVTPRNGVPYTLLDEKGDGKFVRQGEQTTRVTVPMWVLLRW